MDEFDTQVLAPLAVALISWLVKDYIFAVLRKKQEALRGEWSDRLKSFWSPLFFWMGVGLAYASSKQKAEEAVKALEGLLAQHAHLLPQTHYYTVIKLIERLTVLPGRKIDLSEIRDTHAYVKGQIELLNFLLYKKDFGFDPKTQTSLVGSQQAFLRLISQTITHVVTWGLLGLYLYALGFLFFTERWFWLAILLLPLVIAVWRDGSKRLQMGREVEKLQTFDKKTR